MLFALVLGVVGSYRKKCWFGSYVRAAENCKSTVTKG